MSHESSFRGDNQMKPFYLFVLPWQLKEVGGVNEVVRNLYTAVAGQGSLQPGVLINGLHPNSGSSDPITIPIQLGEPFDSSWRGRLSFWLLLPIKLFRLARLCEKLGVAVINPHFPELYSVHFLLLRQLRLFRGHFVLSFHGLDIRKAVRTHGSERWLWRWLVRGADAVICCSEALTREVLSFAPGARVSTIWNGIDAEQFIAKAGQAPRGTDLVPPAPFLLNVATFERKKGHDVLLEAFKHVSMRHPELMLVIAGRSGDTEGALREQIHRNGLDHKVRLLKDVPHDVISQLISRAAMFVMPSRSEGFPIVLLEAGAFSKTVVASSVDGIPELIKDGVDGKLVPAEDPQALCAAIEEMLSHPETALSLGRSLNQKVINQFSWQRACDAYIALPRNSSITKRRRTM